MSDRIPEISVGMPVFNGEKYLTLAIESVLCQTFGDFELIISDNASTDATEDICRAYAVRDRRVRYLRNPRNVGASQNYNLLFERSAAPYFRWFNSDDLSSPRIHELCLKALRDNGDASMAYGQTAIIDADGKVVEAYEDRLDLRQDSVADRFIEFLRVVGLTNAIYGLMRRTALGRTRLMGTGRFPAADTNLMAQLALQGKIVEIPDTLFFRRMHEQSSSWDRTDQQRQKQFWTGASGGFVMPTLKKEAALWSAVNVAPANLAERVRMNAHMLRRMYWARREIAREMFQMFKGAPKSNTPGKAGGLR